MNEEMEEKTMAELSLRNVSKVYGKGHYAVKDFSLDVYDKEFVILVGPSGCGKSTTLRMIAGLEEMSAGELYIDGKACKHVEAKDRDLAMVFQNYALYPHMTVYDNLAFSLSIRRFSKERLSKKEIEKRVMEVARILEIEELLKRRPKDLSGGQKQRVAIGSAIMKNPKVLLMDEPLSNLDAKLRTKLRVELAKLHRELGFTIVYVTHDQTEAMTLGTRIVVMKDGVIQQADTPKNLYENPRNRFVATFIGSPSMNLFETEVGALSNGYCLKMKNGEMLRLSKTQGNLLEEKKVTGKKMELGIRPEDLYDADSRSTYANLEHTAFLEAEVTGRELLGAEVYLYFKMGEEEGIARVEATNQKKKGDKIVLVANIENVQLFDTVTEENIFFGQYTYQPYLESVV